MPALVWVTGECKAFDTTTWNDATPALTILTVFNEGRENLLISARKLSYRDFKTWPILEKFDPTRETADFGSSQNF